MKTTKPRRTKRIPKKKQEALAKLVEQINTKQIIMVASLENISALQFQKIKHSLKKQATIRVVKKTLMIRALEKTKENKAGVEKLEASLIGSFAIIFSDLDPFDLASILAENTTPARVKAGQIAPQNITIEAGLTDLPAGPIISELAKVNIKAGIEAGKIVIKENCVIAKEGEKVSEEAASILAKLEITPVKIGLEPKAVYDSKEKKIYKNIRIDKEGTMKQLIKLATQAKALAFGIVYFTKETISFLIRKAAQESNTISKLNKSETKEESKGQEESTDQEESKTQGDAQTQEDSQTKST